MKLDILKLNEFTKRQYVKGGSRSNFDKCCIAVVRI